MKIPTEKQILPIHARTSDLVTQHLSQVQRFKAGHLVYPITYNPIHQLPASYAVKVKPQIQQQRVIKKTRRIPVW